MEGEVTWFFASGKFKANIYRGLQFPYADMPAYLHSVFVTSLYLIIMYRSKVTDDYTSDPANQAVSALSDSSTCRITVT